MKQDGFPPDQHSFCFSTRMSKTEADDEQPKRQSAGAISANSVDEGQRHMQPLAYIHL